MLFIAAPLDTEHALIDLYMNSGYVEPEVSVT